MSLDEIKCPICDKKKTWDVNNAFRPFCSERCKLIDLDEWASESRTIPGKEADFSSQNDEDM